jgi:hypothetical protein
MPENNYESMVKQALKAAKPRPWYNHPIMRYLADREFNPMQMSPLDAIEALARHTTGDLLFPLERRDRYKAQQQERLKKNVPPAMQLAPVSEEESTGLPMLYPEHIGYPGVFFDRRER